MDLGWTLLFAPLGAAALGVVYWVGLRMCNGASRAGEPPLLRGGWPVLGLALKFGRDAMLLLQQSRRAHGDVFTLVVAGRRMTFVLDPGSYPAVLQSSSLSFHPVSDEVMDSAFCVPDVRARMDLDELDAAARTNLKGVHLESLTKNIAVELVRGLERRDGDPSGPFVGEHGEVDLYDFVWNWTYEAGTQVLFGAGKVCPASAKAFEDFDRQLPQMAAGLPGFMVRSGRAALDVLAPHLADQGKGASSWIRARYGCLSEFDAVTVGRSQTAALWAVHANTIPTAFWTLAHLVANPRALQAIEAELAAELNTTAGQPVLAAELKRLVLLESAVKEALRLSSGSLVLRRVLKPMLLETRCGQWLLRAGDEVCLAPYLNHHDPDIFPEPLTFQHDRFVQDGKARTKFSKRGERVAFAFMPFGAGRSTCPGRFFAINEVKLMVATLLQRFTFEQGTDPMPGFELGRAGLGIFPPKREVRVRWIRRRAA